MLPATHLRHHPINGAHRVAAAQSEVDAGRVPLTTLPTILLQLPAQTFFYRSVEIMLNQLKLLVPRAHTICVKVQARRQHRIALQRNPRGLRHRLLSA